MLCVRMHMHMLRHKHTQPPCSGWNVEGTDVTFVPDSPLTSVDELLDMEQPTSSNIQYLGVGLGVGLVSLLNPGSRPAPSCHLTQACAKTLCAHALPCAPAGCCHPHRPCRRLVGGEAAEEDQVRVCTFMCMSLCA